MDLIVHACDISQQCRPFEVVEEWTYLLFEEFFEQGDMEKEAGLSVSMLCDRDDTNVAQAQPGFINFVVMPLYNVVEQILFIGSEEDGCVTTLKENIEKWKSL